MMPHAIPKIRLLPRAAVSGPFSIAMLLIFGTQTSGAGKVPAAPTYTTYSGAVAGFRCSVSSAGQVSCPVDGGPVDAIRGDGNLYLGDPGISTSFGAFFVTYSRSIYDDFALKLDGTGGRYVVLDFSAQLGAGTCGAACRKNFSEAKITSTLGIQGTLVRPVDDHGSDLVGGMSAIRIGSTVRAKLKLNFPDPGGRSLWWTLRFNPAEYPGSDFVRVTRTAAGSWTIEAGGYLDSADQGRANLVASPDGSGRKQTEEGVYLMPFRIDVSV